MKIKWADIPGLLKDAYAHWNDDKAPRLGAALAYYTIFSLAPLLLIAVAIAGFVFGPDAARGGIKKEFAAVLGPPGAAAVQMMLASTNKPSANILATIVGVLTVLFGASGVFGSLQDALNTIWGVAPKPDRGIWGFIQDRFLSFAMVGGICFLLLASLVVSTLLAAIGNAIGDAFGLYYLWWSLNFLVSIAVITLLFAMIFKVLPDVKLTYSDVWTGAIATAILYTLGKFALGIYLGRASVESAYGAAASLMALLVWIYYSAQILFFGAEFTKVYAAKTNSKIKVDDNAVAMTHEMRAREGIPRADAVKAAANGGHHDIAKIPASVVQPAAPGGKPGTTKAVGRSTDSRQSAASRLNVGRSNMGRSNVVLSNVAPSNVGRRSPRAFRRASALAANGAAATSVLVGFVSGIVGLIAGVLLSDNLAPALQSYLGLARQVGTSGKTNLTGVIHGGSHEIRD